MHPPKRWILLLGLLLAPLWVGTARAEKLAYLGTHTLTFSNLGPLDVSVSGVGVANVATNGSGHLTTLQLSRHFPGGILNGVFPVTDPAVNATIPAVHITSLRINPQVQGGIFAPISGATGSGPLLTLATMPLTGTIRLCILDAGCGAGAVTETLAATTSSVYTGVGIGGVFTNAGPTYAIQYTGQPWTLGTVTVSNRTPAGAITTQTAMGFARGALSGTSSTASPGGVVQLVTASQIHTTGIPGNNDISGQIHTLTLEFVPEPGLLLMLGCGALAMGLLGRRRLSR
ncbi:MAG: hypothetical protein OEM49_02410 [Myxococcales bacterium]|nr:hypothetical protein [Myxococcales bacterium]MDH5306308.1 hypothetical protein [Myxococcales bacterium]MDH5567143.1 hypothetical protein [Myxococcales bacterium]